jgi:lipid A ethanolaminephosphotransferase
MTPRPLPSGRGPLRLVLAHQRGHGHMPGNWPLWQALADLGLLQSAQGWGLAVALALAVFGALVALLSLLAWRWTLKPALAIFLLLAAAAGAHFMGAYRIVIDPTMLVNVLQTNPGEAADLFSLRMLGTVVLLAACCPPGWCGARPCSTPAAAAPAGHNLLATVAAWRWWWRRWWPASSRCRPPCATTSSCAT